MLSPAGRDQKYLDVAINFTNEVFVSSFLINLFPEFLKPCVSLFTTDHTSTLTPAAQAGRARAPARLAQQERAHADGRPTAQRAAGGDGRAGP